MELIVGAAILGGATAAVAGGRAIYLKKKRDKIAKKMRSRDLKVFGVPFADALFKADNGVPSVIEECVVFLDRKYNLENMQNEIDEAFVKAEQNGCMTMDINSLINFAEFGQPLELDNYPVSEAVFVLLEYFIELPVSIFPPFLFQDLKHAIDEPLALQAQSILRVFNQLPEISQLVLRRILPLYGDIFKHFSGHIHKDIFLSAIAFSIVTSDQIVQNQLEDDCFAVLHDINSDSDPFTASSSSTTTSNVTLNDDDTIITGTDGAFTFSDDEDDQTTEEDPWDVFHKIKANPNPPASSFPTHKPLPTPPSPSRDHNSVPPPVPTRTPLSASGPQPPTRVFTSPLYQGPVSTSSSSLLKPLPSVPSSSSLSPPPSLSQSSPSPRSPRPPSSSSGQSSRRQSVSEAFPPQVLEDRAAVFRIVETLITSFRSSLDPVPPASHVIVKKKKKKLFGSKKDKKDKKSKTIDKMKPLH